MRDDHRHKHGHTFYAQESLPMRVSGFGSEYFTYLARALVKWAMIALALGAGFVFLRWMIRTDVLISDRTWNGLLVCGVGAIIIRVVQEVFPREIWVRDGKLVLHHSNWSSSLIELPDIENVRQWKVTNSISRVQISVVRRGKQKYFLCAMRNDDATAFVRKLRESGARAED